MSGSLPFLNEFFRLVVEGMLIFHCTEQGCLEMEMDGALSKETAK